MGDSLAPDAVKPLLRGRFGRIYRHFESCTSTQRLFEADDEEGAVVVAEEQTEGRGRLGREWHAPPRSSVLVSVLLTPPVDPPRLPELSLVAGRAVAEALADQAHVLPTLKFPNDVLIGGKKVAGILAEASAERVILGIGVNVHQSEDELPADTETPATSLRHETGMEHDRAALLAAILDRLELRYDEWVRATGSAASG